jgi:hypothetical protein
MVIFGADMHMCSCCTSDMNKCTLMKTCLHKEEQMPASTHYANMFGNFGIHVCAETHEETYACLYTSMNVNVWS